MPKLDAALHSDVQAYLKENHATADERAAVWKMVHEGQDHLSNPWYYAFEGGLLMDLLTALRFEQDQQEWYEELLPEERKELFGDHYGPPTKDAWDFRNGQLMAI
jgi:hypothetical protein